ncbi:hypothetical protein C414_000260075 [Campylobacter jejuni subsp. jejuni 414]|nr:hypothetical protein C414_000260075 [Campylobacter jejuni subsp. jejuni 414]
MIFIWFLFKDKILNESVKKNYDFIVMGHHKNTHNEYFLLYLLKKRS